MPEHPERHFRHELGFGGGGSVWSYHQSHLNRDAAVKIPRTPFNHQTRTAFLNEARLMSAVASPYVVRALEYVEFPLYALPKGVLRLIEGAPKDGDAAVMGIVMERAAGRVTVRPDRRLPDVYREIDEMLDGLATMHGIGIVHNDVKPTNLLTDEHGHVKHSDFGSASRLVALGDLDATQLATPAAPRVTTAYGAPEQFARDGAPASTTIDVYQAAATAFALLTGRDPFVSPRSDEIARLADDDPSRSDRIRAARFELERMIVDEPTPDPRDLRPELPVAIGEWVLRGLAKRPEDRWADAREALDAWRAAVDAARHAAEIERTVLANATGEGSAVAIATHEVRERLDEVMQVLVEERTARTASEQSQRAAVEALAERLRIQDDATHLQQQVDEQLQQLEILHGQADDLRAALDEQRRLRAAHEAELEEALERRTTAERDRDAAVRRAAELESAAAKLAVNRHRATPLPAPPVPPPSTTTPVASKPSTSAGDFPAPGVRRSGGGTSSTPIRSVDDIDQMLAAMVAKDEQGWIEVRDDEAALVMAVSWAPRHLIVVHSALLAGSTRSFLVTTDGRTAAARLILATLKRGRGARAALEVTTSLD